MGKFFAVTILIIASLVGGFYYLDKITFRNSGKTLLTRGTINFGTQEFANGMPIPVKFTCDGKNVNPTFYIERVPEYAKSLAMVLDEPEAVPGVFTHWLIFNINPEITIFEERDWPSGSVVATNDFGKKEYSGPCPSLGEHKYFFRIYALDTVLSLDDNAKRADFDKAIKGHVITTGETYGTYNK